jgi:hypothetical protein
MARLSVSFYVITSDTFVGLYHIQFLHDLVSFKFALSTTLIAEQKVKRKKYSLYKIVLAGHNHCAV